MHSTAQDVANMFVVFVADLVDQINTVSTCEFRNDPRHLSASFCRFLPLELF